MQSCTAMNSPFPIKRNRWAMDSIWFPEHHFTGYSMCANPLLLLAYMPWEDANRSFQLFTEEVQPALKKLPHWRLGQRGWHKCISEACGLSGRCLRLLFDGK